MKRSLTSPELALSLCTSEASTAAIRERVANLKLETSEDSMTEPSTIDPDNGVESLPVESKSDEVFENKEKKVEASEGGLEAAKSTESVVSPVKKPERTPRKSLLIKNLLSQAGICRNVEKVSTFEERLKEREKVIKMNEKPTEQKQPSLVQSSKSKSNKKTEKLRRSNSSDSLRDCKTTDGSMKARFPLLEKFLDEKNNSVVGDQKSFVTGALDLSVSVPQYRKFQQGDIDCCTYGDVSSRSFYVKDDLRRFFEKKALRWKNYHKNLVDSHCHFDMLFNK